MRQGLGEAHRLRADLRDGAGGARCDHRGPPAVHRGGRPDGAGRRRAAGRGRPGPPSRPARAPAAPAGPAPGPAPSPPAARLGRGRGRLPAAAGRVRVSRSRRPPCRASGAAHRRGGRAGLRMPSPDGPGGIPQGSWTVSGHSYVRPVDVAREPPLGITLVRLAYNTSDPRVLYDISHPAPRPACSRPRGVCSPPRCWPSASASSAAGSASGMTAIAGLLTWVCCAGRRGPGGPGRHPQAEPGAGQGRTGNGAAGPKAAGLGSGLIPWADVGR